jgi:hypothetical protein
MDRITGPLHEEGQLGIDLQVLYPELLPGEHGSVRQVAMPLDCRPAQPLLPRSKIVNGHYPA